MNSSEQINPESQLNPEWPRPRQPTPKPLIQSPYYPTEERPASLSEVESLFLAPCHIGTQPTQVTRTTENPTTCSLQYPQQQYPTAQTKALTQNEKPTKKDSSSGCESSDNDKKAPPEPQPNCRTSQQDVSTQIADALVRITQQQRLPQSKPGIFTGSEEEKPSFFLWQNAFDALVDSVQIPARQKLYLLNQHLAGRAKKVVEQLQYMVDQPEVAYNEARKIIRERFGNNAMIGANFEKRLATWPKINPSDAVALQEFSDFLRQVFIASRHIESLKVYNYPSKIQPLLEKLPSWYKSKWSVRVMKYQKANGKETFPPFEEFVNHVSQEAERINIPQLFPTAEPTAKKAGDNDKRRFHSRTTALASMTSETAFQDQAPSTKDDPHTSSRPPATFCFYHERSSHSLKDCEKFQKLTYPERKEFLMTHRICLKCVNSDKHIARNCDQKELECKICKKKHPTCLHNPSRHDEQAKSSCTKVCGENQSGRSCARIVLLQIFHQDDPTIRIPTYAVLDDQSTDVFVTDALLERLDVDGPEITLDVNTIVGVNSIRTRKVTGLCVQDVEGRHQPIKVNYAQNKRNPRKTDASTRY